MDVTGPSLPEAAREYATARGWAVFPCQPRGKTPATEHGCKDATTDPAVVEAVWRTQPKANIGISTDDLVVIDEDGPAGRKSLAALEAKYGPLPATLTQRTGRLDGGRQFIYRRPPGVDIRNSAGKLGDGLDVRSIGGYFIAPPSIHPTGKTYEWIDPNCPIAELPAWVVVDLATPAQSNGDANGADHGGEFAEGQRNDALFRLARSLKLKSLSQAAVLAAVLAENQTRCRPPLPEAEAAAIVANSFKQPDREGFTVRDITALPVAIRNVVLAKKLALFDKKRGVFGLIRDALLSDGFLCRTTDGRLFYFGKNERRLYDLNSADFSYLLTAKSGLSATESFFGFALNRLEAATACLSPTPVHTLGHYDISTGLLAVSDAGPGVWVRERGGEWIRTHNGENGLLFFTECSATPFEPDFENHESSWFLSNFEFVDNPPLSAADAKTLHTIALLQQFFPKLRRTRLISAFLGPKGSGKTTKIRTVGRLILGPDFDVTNLREEKEDGFVAAITNSTVIGVDNADSRVRWLEDGLATYATGLKYKMRRYYTTNEQAEFLPRAFLMLSSRDPHFRREDVAERLLPLLSARPETFLDEGEIYDQLEKRRSAIWGDLLCMLAQTADAQQQTAPRMKFRMADFAAFGWKLLKAKGREGDWPTLLDRLEKTQLGFAGEGNGIIDALREVLALGPIVQVATGDLFKKCEAVAKEHTFGFPRTSNGFGQKLANLINVIELELECKVSIEPGRANRKFVTLTQNQ